MSSAEPHRGKRPQAAFVVMLAACLLLFAIWLKAQPAQESGSAGASSTVKLWVDPTQASDIQLLKITLISGVLFFLFVAPALFRGRGWPLQPIPASRFAAKDVFADSQHWFRPPPLS
jgi:hypothetical protein